MMQASEKEMAECHLLQYAAVPFPKYNLLADYIHTGPCYNYFKQVLVLYRLLTGGVI